jgi:low affinity Fe/Cu permease
MQEIFRKIAHKVGEKAGKPWAFASAISIIIIWFLSGQYFDYSDTWQLVINTGTTIITFLMVFLIQNMQNRDSRELHLKLDEIIRSIKSARNDFVDLEELTESELNNIQKQFKDLKRDPHTPKE